MTTSTETQTIQIAIQGGAGAFHEMAAAKFFCGIDFRIHPCETFEDVFYELATGKCDSGIMAIENSVAGSILPNYTMLRKSGFKVVGEVYLRIIQNLMALPGETLQGLGEIHSHPVAIQQCSLFLEPFRKKGVKIVETSDTALSARRISKLQLKGIAALAIRNAAELYQLEILAAGVESDKQNFTRFLVISGNSRVFSLDKDNRLAADKASLCFSLPHEAGSLSQILSVLAYYNLNLTKIQSLPIVGRAWEYLFYADLVFTDFQRYRQALAAITPLTDLLEILGEYKQGEMPG